MFLKYNYFKVANSFFNNIFYPLVWFILNENKSSSFIIIGSFPEFVLVNLGLQEMFHTKKLYWVRSTTSHQTLTSIQHCGICNM